MLNKLKPKSEFSRNVLTLMTGTTIAQAIPIAISPILTRIYTPEDFGIFALFVAIVGFISLLASARYEQAIIIPKLHKYAINLFTLGLLFATTTSLFTLLFVLLFKESILSLLNNASLNNWLYMIPVTVFFISFFNLLVNYNNRMKNYQDIAQATIVKSIALSIIQVLLGLLRYGYTGLIIGQILAQLFANIRLLKNITKDKTFLKLISFKNMYILMKKYRNFPKYNMPHALLGNISSNLPVYLFTPIFGSTTVGYYSFSLMVVLSPMMIIAGSTAKVYNQKVVEIYNNNGDTYLFTMNIIKSLLKKILIPFVIFVAFAPQIFKLIFGNQWVESGEYIQILSVFLILNIVVSIIAYIPSLKNLQKKAYNVAIIHFILLSSGLYISSMYYNIFIVLGFMCFINSLVLIYNFVWMTNSLKAEN